MNYWRRYTADYGSKTGANTMIEDGAYTRLLDWYYEHEKPLPAELERIYTIAKAMKPPERKAVDHVLAAFFLKAADGWHNKRADEELATALPKLETLRKVAKENGAKGGRPKKEKTESGSMNKPNPVPELVREQEPERQPDPEPSSQPLNHTTNPNTAFPVLETSRPEPPPNSGTEKNAKLEAERPGMLKLLEKHRVMGVEDHPLIVDRLLRIAKHEHITQAFHEAGRAKGGAPYDIGFYAAILERIAAAAREADEQQRAAAEARLKATQDQIADQREMAKSAVPMPETLLNFRAPKWAT